MSDQPRLLETVEEALELAGPIEFPCAEQPEGVDRLVCARRGSDAGWGLVPRECLPESEMGTVIAAVDSAWEDDWLPISDQLAGVLVEKHLEAWLLQRGWQLQVSLRKTGEQAWRLADCLAFADGGGDRLDADYPTGTNRLAALAASVLAVSRFTFARPGAI